MQAGEEGGKEEERGSGARREEGRVYRREREREGRGPVVGIGYPL
jgi:hypothetical protein